MSIKLFSKAALASAVIMAASAASAATFDFVAMADNSGDANWIGLTELNWSDTDFALGLTIGGIKLVASGSNLNGTAADAFFDKGSAGLGVCSSVSCATGVSGAITSDDNVSGGHGGETLRLAFDSVVNLTNLFFRNSQHPALTGSLNINGGAVSVVGGVITGGFASLIGASTYDFQYTGDEFYVSTVTAEVSPVPLPAGGLLLLSGLAGVAALKRRKKRAA